MNNDNGKKTTVWTFEATNKWHLKRENIDVAKKRETLTD